jgi:hypothetical protein
MHICCSSGTGGGGRRGGASNKVPYERGLLSAPTYVFSFAGRHVTPVGFVNGMRAERDQDVEYSQRQIS